MNRHSIGTNLIEIEVISVNANANKFDTAARLKAKSE